MSPTLEITRDGLLSALRWHAPALAEVTERSYRDTGAAARLTSARPQPPRGRQTTEEDDRHDRAGR